MLDVFFISMGEVGAEENFQRLLQFAPNAKRVTDVNGIYAVHKACALQSTTENFYVVDADAWIVDRFDFLWKPSKRKLHWGVPETECVINWLSINPVNGLIYGYGAVKMFPRTPFLVDTEWTVDMSSSIVKVAINKDIVSNETRFNVTPESAWIGAFRECAKLASLAIIKARIKRIKQREQDEVEQLSLFVSNLDCSDIHKTNHRSANTVTITNMYKDEQNILNHWPEIETCSQRRMVWTTTSQKELNGEYAILGARAGASFGIRNSDDIQTLNLINNWDWLKKEFKNVNV